MVQARDIDGGTGVLGAKHLAFDDIPGRRQSKIPNTWSGHRTAQIDPEKCRKSMAAKFGSDDLTK